jgi:glutathione S-transferase
MEALMAAGLLAFDQTPLLQIDGLNLVQKMAAVRYLARKHGLYGADNEEATRIDILAEGASDFASAVLQATDDASRAAACAKYLPRFERAMASSKCLAGDRLSFADIMLFHVFLRLRDSQPSQLETAIAGHPLLVGLEQRIAALPTMAEYLSDSTKHFPHPGLPGYMDRVVATIPWIRPGGPAPPAPRSTLWNYKQSSKL